MELSLDPDQSEESAELDSVVQVYMTDMEDTGTATATATEAMDHMEGTEIAVNPAFCKEYLVDTEVDTVDTEATEDTVATGSDASDATDPHRHHRRRHSTEDLSKRDDVTTHR